MQQSSNNTNKKTTATASRTTAKKTANKATAVATPNSKEALREAVEQKLKRYYGILPAEATADQMYRAVVLTVKDILMHKRTAQHNMVKKKIIILKFSNFCFADSEDPALLKKFQLFELLEERIHKNQLNILRLERLLFKCKNTELHEKITKRINKIKQARKSKLELLENFNMCRSNKWLAKEMNIKNSTVSSLLMRAKKKLATQKIEIVLFPTVDNEDKKI